MIVGIFLRYFKTYTGWTYIPLSNADNFCGLVGENGVGKSSVLEALDCFFNSRDWNINLQVKKSGEARIAAAIAPVFLLTEDKLPTDKLDILKILSNALKEETKTGGATTQTMSAFYSHRDKLAELYPEYDSKYLICASTDRNGNFSQGNTP